MLWFNTNFSINGYDCINNQIEIPGHLNYATYQLKGSWTDNYGNNIINGETKIPKSNLVELLFVKIVLQMKIKIKGGGQLIEIKVKLN